MEVLYSGYQVSFHHLSLVSREPLEFPSYSSGSVKAQALQGEVGKMLGEGALQMVKIPGLCYDS